MTISFADHPLLAGATAMILAGLIITAAVALSALMTRRYSEEPYDDCCTDRAPLGECWICDRCGDIVVEPLQSVLSPPGSDMEHWCDRCVLADSEFHKPYSKKI